MSKRIERGRRQREKPLTPSVPTSPDVPIRDMPPTTLMPFRFSEEQLVEVRRQGKSALAFQRDSAAIHEPSSRLQSLINQRLADNSEMQTVFVDQENYLLSCATASRAYLSMVDYLGKDVGLSDEVIFHFFKSAIVINNSINEAFFRLAQINRNKTSSLISLFQGSLARQLGIEAPYRKMIAIPPWHPSNKTEWASYVARNAIFRWYKDLGDPALGTTAKNAVPDWFSQNPDKPPQPEQVAQEAQADLSQRAVLIQMGEKAREQLHRIDSLEGSLLEPAAYVEERKRETFPSPPKTLAEVIFFLGVTSDVFEYTIEQDMIGLPPILEQYRRTSQELREKTIQDFALLQEEKPSVELLALLLEVNLVEAELIKNAKDRINNNHIGTFNLFFDAIEGNEEEKAAFQTLADFYPNVDRVLMEEVAPLLLIVPPEERAMLGEMLQGYQAQEIEQFIWDMAELIGANWRDNSASSKFKTFTVAWLGKNWQEAYRQLLKVLGLEASPSDQQDVSPQIQAQIPFIEKAIDELALGNLAGWHIYYAKQQTTDKRRVQEIDGETLAQRHEAFEAFFAKNNLAGDPRHILHLFNYLILIPQDVEETKRPKSGKDRFKRMKLGDLRILYFVDPLKKEVVFSVEAKAA